MDTIAAKVANLTYEFFGVVLPGLIAIVVWTGVALTWLFADKLIRPSEAVDYYRKASHQGLVTLGALVLACYLVGHFLLWFSREGVSGLVGRVRPSGQPNPTKQFVTNQAMRFLLLLGVVRGEKDFDPILQPVRDACAKRLAGEDSAVLVETAKWRVFYLLATNTLAHAGVTSLVTTYRNKYTMHRSLATALALGFWAALVLMVVAITIEGHFVGLFLAQAAVCGLFVLVFSASYKNYWLLLGSTAVVEAYVLTKAPKEGP